jgi:broad specificity phosphatase PhoE
MGEVYLIRHGETAWNLDQVFRGRADIPLSERGQQQAQLLGQALAERPVAAVYSSPLSRARETAAPLAEELGLEVLVDERLVDMSFGEWEGLSVTDVEQRWPELHEVWTRTPAAFSAPGGETLSAVLARSRAAFEEISERHPVAAIVSHRVICKLLLCHALGVGEKGFWRVRLDTASVSVVENDGEDRVVTGINDRHHLAPLGEADRRDF